MAKVLIVDDERNLLEVVAGARYLSSARRELAELSSLIDDLFELAGVPQLTPEEVSLHDLISDTISSVQCDPGRGSRFCFTLRRS
ncbi:hypothetical protein GBA63_13780 [Rubrobacter tropicus]|uniref:Uncharacterized protein n=1 Tax=Rubrobacter tropicus TaxID=2653851 RepID=A0A6G8QBA9_9ACTN|nr:hypothetical protein [Rubrobacter tropicus]QIN83587.1 hypothetical protein GBA63_13780 [Rubrobacter tropicus]